MASLYYMLIGEHIFPNFWKEEYNCVIYNLIQIMQELK